MNKTVGIITMHRPISFGSALQAYALQKKITDMGVVAELIDYQYPNKIHGFEKKGIRAYFSSVVSSILNAIFGFPDQKKKKKFKTFFARNCRLSSYYPTENSLLTNPPKYDLYCTGSDQVWNPLFTKTDSSFLLSFVKERGCCFSYASSFAINYIPSQYEELFIRYLPRYNNISVREESGIKLVNELVGREAKLVCDPTLLLNKNEWNVIANQASINIKEPYILVFMLCYSFNPYPQVQHIIDDIQSKLGLKVVYLDGGKRDYFRGNSCVIKTAGPSEFVKLIRDAHYIITSSFHGVIFSTLFGKPFTAVVKEDNNDSRIMSYLKRVDMEECAVMYNSHDIVISDVKDGRLIKPFVELSEQYLSNCIK